MTIPLPPTNPRGRLAPSPSGRMHLGNAFAFLTAWLCARSRHGTLVLRMEDIDPARCRPEYADGIMQDLTWLGLDWDEGPDCGGPLGPYTQSLRLQRYADALADLRGRGLVYPCFCTRKDLRAAASAPHIGDEGVPYPGTCRELAPEEQEARLRAGRPAAFRLNVAAALAALGPEAADLGFTDLLRGPMRADPTACGGDFALMRSDGVPAYQLAVSVDDADMGITQVVRGEDLLCSTPRQILLLRIIKRGEAGEIEEVGERAKRGEPSIPEYLHLPLLRDADDERLAKRHRSLELCALRDAGVASTSVVGYLGYLLGCLPEPAPLSARELLPLFRVELLAEKAQRTPADMRVPPDIMERLRSL